MPVVAIHVMIDDDPHGPGMRETGQRFIHSGDEAQTTDDLRCRGCGAKAREIHLMTVAGIGPTPTGRQICPA
jgi:hypothetical protein